MNETDKTPQTQAGGVKPPAPVFSPRGLVQGDRWGVGLLPRSLPVGGTDPKEGGGRKEAAKGAGAPAFPPKAAPSGPWGAGRGSFWPWLRPRPAAVPAVKPAAKGALWSIGLEWRSLLPDRPVVMVARLRARTPSANVLVTAQLLAGAAAVLKSRGFVTDGGKFTALPVLEGNAEHPANPPDWSGPLLELWFDGFTPEAGAARAES